MLLTALSASSGVICHHDLHPQSLQMHPPTDGRVLSCLQECAVSIGSEWVDAYNLFSGSSIRAINSNASDFSLNGPIGHGRLGQLTNHFRFSSCLTFPPVYFISTPHKSAHSKPPTIGHPPQQRLSKQPVLMLCSSRYSHILLFAFAIQIRTCAASWSYH